MMHAMPVPFQGWELSPLTLIAITGKIRYAVSRPGSERCVFRGSLYVVKDIKAGEVIKWTTCALSRLFTDCPHYLKDILSARSVQNVASGTALIRAVVPK